jgi:hypothetical protein
MGRAIAEGGRALVEDARDGELWPIIGHLYLVKIGGVLQHEVYMFDQGDCEPGGSAPPFWSREGLDDCPVFDPATDQWVALDAIDSAMIAAQQPVRGGNGGVIQRHVVTKYRDGSVHVADVTVSPRAAAAGDRMDELRRACAELLGCDPDAWPAHGNAPLAIAAALAMALKQGSNQP